VDPNPKKNEFGSTTLVKVEESDKKWTSADDDDDEAVKDLSNQLVSADEAKELIAMYTTTVVGAATAAASSDEEGKENGGGGRVFGCAKCGKFRAADLGIRKNYDTRYRYVWLFVGSRCLALQILSGSDCSWSLCKMS
jgi:hypothetical protein